MRYIQTGKTEYNEDGSIKKSGCVPVSSDVSRSHFVGVFEEVVAPDGTRIASRAQMDEFQRRTGQTNDLDHLREMGQREMSRKISSPGTPEQRKAVIRDAIERVSSSGFHRHRRYIDE